MAALVALSALGWGWTTSQEVPWDLGTPKPAVPFKPARLEQVATHACASCHAEVAEEWALSAHGMSWVDEEYQHSLEGKRRPQLCYGCHIPEALLATGSLPPAAPKAREESSEAWHFGISCESCHLGPEGAMLGPHGADSSAHASLKSEHMIGAGSNGLCMACHSTSIGPVKGLGKDFVEAGFDEDGMSCVACHMATVERVWGTEPEGEPVAARLGRSHLLQTPRDPAFLRRAFRFEVLRADGGVLVRIHNEAGHRVPGLNGRDIEFQFQVLDGTGKVLARERRSLDTRSYLPVADFLEVAIGGDGEKVRLLGRSLDPRADKPVGFLDETVEVGSR